MAFLQAIINDKKHLQHLKAALPNIIPNDRDLLTEICNALRESTSGEEYGLLDWEGKCQETGSVSEGCTGVDHLRSHSPSPKGDASRDFDLSSYFDKGKFVHEDMYEGQQGYKRTHSKPKATDRARRQWKSRVSVGITLDDIRPLGKLNESVNQPGKPDLKSSMGGDDHHHVGN